jgi:signal-transduction protein with cAMP-binding, CBS, and nucleotidyltransferase domain
MSETALTIGPGHTLRQAAEQMARKRVGSAIVSDPEAPGPSILTERDILIAVGRGLDVDGEQVGDHVTADVVVAEPEWSLEQAAETMTRGGFRHLIVVESGEVVGMVSMRDIVRCWTQDGATSSMQH